MSIMWIPEYWIIIWVMIMSKNLVDVCIEKWTAWLNLGAGKWMQRSHQLGLHLSTPGAGATGDITTGDHEAATSAKASTQLQAVLQPEQKSQQEKVTELSSILWHHRILMTRIKSSSSWSVKKDNAPKMHRRTSVSSSSCWWLASICFLSACCC